MPSQVGVRSPRHATIDKPMGATATPLTFEFPDFHVNWISITASFQGATDEPTEAEKLAKLGTFNIKTKGGRGSWITNLSFADLFYENVQRIHEGQLPFLAGDGGGDDDFHTMEVILDAGCGRNIQSSCGWASMLNGELEINPIADSGLDNTRIRVTFWGYEGQAPRRVRKVKYLSETGVAGEEGTDIKFNGGDLLQSIWAFETTERNLATVQVLDAYTVKEIHIKHDGQLVSDKFYGSELISGLKDTVAGAHEYCGVTYDPVLTGMGLPMNGKSIVNIEAGASDAMRVYTSVLERLR